MGAVEEIKNLRSLGKTDVDIFEDMQKKGYTIPQISDALSQSKIKDAVSKGEPSQEPENESQTQNPDIDRIFKGSEKAPPQEVKNPSVEEDSPKADNAMTPSMMSQEPEEEESSAPSESQKEDVQEPQGEMQSYPQDIQNPNQEQFNPYMAPNQEQEVVGQPAYYGENQGYDQGYYDPNYNQYAQEYSQEYPQGYDQYQSYPGYQVSISPDTITEIAEQVLEEKLSHLHDKIDSSSDFKNTAETKLDHLKERIERIEKILDKLQLSILNKVGQYVTDVSDLKTELQETQKTFKALVDEKTPKRKSPTKRKKRSTKKKKK